MESGLIEGFFLELIFINEHARIINNIDEMFLAIVDLDKILYKGLGPLFVFLRVILKREINQMGTHNETWSILKALLSQCNLFMLNQKLILLTFCRDH